jgi:mannan endo-1,4-beta-mannosidase
VRHFDWTITLLFLAASTGSAWALEPANPKANAKARAILNYLERLPQRSDRRLLSGQFTDAGPTAKLAMCEEVHKKTGHWPAMIGLDYADFTKGGLEYKTVNRVAIEYAKQGGLVTISAHLCNPANPKSRGPWEPGADLQKLITPGNEVHDRWMKELDIMAAGLKELQDADVVVLWRPFHEMNGDWFWWGAKEPETFIRVWQQMFDYFTKTKGLNNLLWVYSPNHGEKTAAYYAGDRYVDIVGLDACTDFVDPQHIRGYEAVAKLPKPFGFTEFGPFGPHNPPGNYDYPRFLAGVQKHFPKTTFFLAWHYKWSLGRNQNARQLLEHPWLVNRENLPAEVRSPASATPNGRTIASVPPGAAALGYTKRVINETLIATDVAPGKNGNFKWFSGQWYSQKVPSLDHYSTRTGTLALSLLEARSVPRAIGIKSWGTAACSTSAVMVWAGRRGDGRSICTLAPGLLRLRMQK